MEERIVAEKQINYALEVIASSKAVAMHHVEKAPDIAMEEISRLGGMHTVCMALDLTDLAMEAWVAQGDIRRALNEQAKKGNPL